MKKWIPFVTLAPYFLFAVVANIFVLVKGSTDSAISEIQQNKGIYYEKTTTTKNQGVHIITTEKTWVTDGGKRTVSHKHEKRIIKMMDDRTEESNSIHITDGNEIITYDPDTKEGTIMENNLTDAFSDMSEDNMEQFAKEMSDAFDAETKKIKPKKIAGKLCEGTETVTNLGGMKTVTVVYMWNNFIMESQSEGMGTETSEIVTKFDEGISVDEDLFKVRSDVKLKKYKSPF